MEKKHPKTSLAATIVIAALLIAIILLATGAVRFGPDLNSEDARQSASG